MGQGGNMNEKLLQKKGKIVSQIATELLGKQVNDRMLPIMDYQKKFQTSQGTIQNAINFLKEKRAIQLVNKGYLGSYVKAIDYDILQEYCEKMDIVGCMPIPRNETLEVLAYFLMHKLKDKLNNLHMNYIQTEERLWHNLYENQCDFIVCSLTSAQAHIQDDDKYEVLMDLGDYTLRSNLVMVHKHEALHTLGIIENDMVLKKIGMDYAKQRQLNYTYVSKWDVVTALRQDKIQAFIDGEEEVKFITDCHKTSIDALYKKETRAVIVGRKDRYDIQQLLIGKLLNDDLRRIVELYKEGNIEVEF